MRLGQPNRIKLGLLVGGIAVVTVANWIALSLVGPLATRHPLALIALDSRNRYLILAHNVDLIPFLVVGTLRRVLTDPLYWLLGHWYGDRALRWLEHNAGFGKAVSVVERAFAKAAYPMVFLLPGPIVCALAGSSGMPFVRFLVVNVAGTLTAVSVLRLFGDVFDGPVNAVLGLFSRHLVATMVVSIGLVVLSIVLNRVQGNSELPPVEEFEAEADASPDE